MQLPHRTSCSDQLPSSLHLLPVQSPTLRSGERGEVCSLAVLCNIDDGLFCSVKDEVHPCPGPGIDANPLDLQAKTSGDAPSVAGPLPDQFPWIL
jgi:hypothetical protein